MNINVTLFIQIGNFFITYYILKKLFFKSVIHSIQHRQNSEHALSQKIKKGEGKLLLLEKEKHQKMSDFQINIRKQIKEIEEKKLPYEFFEIPFEEISDAQLQELEKKSLDLLIKKAPHGY